MIDVAMPAMIKKYNQFMGGVDKSNHFMSYHHVPRQTIHYWKTPFLPLDRDHGNKRLHPVQLDPDGAGQEKSDTRSLSG